MTNLRQAGLLLSCLAASGCSAAFAAAAGGGIDTRGNASTEGRGEVAGEVGDDDFSIYASTALGGGYYATDVGYFLLHGELGVGFGGSSVHTTLGVSYTGRVNDGAFSAVGGAATTYFRLTEETVGQTYWALGPRLSVTAFEDFTRQWVALFHLSLVLRAGISSTFGF